MPHPRSSRGAAHAFTLVEMAAALAVLAVLSVAAFGTYTAFTRKAADAAAEQLARTATAAEQQMYTRTGAFTATPADLTAAESSVTYLAPDTASTSPGHVSVATGYVSGDPVAAAAAASASGHCILRRVGAPDASTTALDVVIAPTATNPCTGTTAVRWEVPAGQGAPDAPVLTAAPADGQITLTWPAVTGATHYRVYRDSTLLADTPGTGYTDTAVTNGTSYTYQVTAVGPGGPSAPATTSATPTASAPPAPALSGTIGHASATLTWTAPAGAVSYQVRRDGTTVTSTRATTFTDTGLSDGTSYAYTVTATNAAGTSPASNTLTLTPAATAPPAPQAPTGLSAAPSPAGASAKVDLTWTAPAAGSAVTGYQVLRAGAVVASTTGTSWTDTTVLAGATYSYQVRAYNAGGTSPATSSVSATLPAATLAAPGAPAPVTATGLDQAVVVSWQAGPGGAPTSYQVLRNGTQVATVTGTAWTDTAVSNGTSYSYTVQAVNAAGTSPASAAATATPAAAPAQCAGSC